MFPAPALPPFTPVPEGVVATILGGAPGGNICAAICGLLLSAIRAARCAVEDGADPAATLATLLAEVDTIARVKARLQAAAATPAELAA